MKKLTKKEKESRIIARGEHSGHSHVITGNATVRDENGQIMIDVHEDGEAIIRHLIESDWMTGKETHTGEHADIVLKKGTYKYVPQLEFHPYENVIRQVRD